MKKILAGLTVLAATAEAKLEPGVYAFFSNHTGQVLDVWGISKKDGASIAVHPWKQGDNQQFFVNETTTGCSISAYHTKKALTISNPAKDSEIVQKAPNAKDVNQQFEIIEKGHGLVAIQVKSTKKFLTVKQSAKDGDKIFQASANAQANGINTQLFKPYKIDTTQRVPLKDEGIYAFYSNGANMPIEVNGVSRANGAKIGVWHFWGAQNQYFTLKKSATAGYFRMIALHTGKVVEAQKNGFITQENRAPKEKDSQLWKFTEAKAGTYVIENKQFKDAIQVTTKKGEWVRHAPLNVENKFQQFRVIEVLK